MTDELLANPRFPRTAKYHPEWIRAGASGGANSLWLTEWLSEALDLQPGLEADAGRTIGYVRVVGRRRRDAKLDDPIVSAPLEYTRRPLLR